MKFKQLVAVSFFVTLMIGCGGNNDNKKADNTQEQTKTGSGGLSSPTNKTSVANDTIAYVSSSLERKSIRLIQSDGRGDRELWSAPTNDLISPAIGTLAWRPDGSELAFDSDHNFGKSIYGRDLYAITSDGSYLRKITNPPEPQYLASYSKGKAKIQSQNWLSGGANFWAYMEGNSATVTWLAANIQDFTITFDNVADFGTGVKQYTTVGWLSYNERRMCLYDLAGFADIVPGKTVEVVQRFDAWGHKSEHCTTLRQPSWSHDGEKILYTVISGVDQFDDALPISGLSTYDFENYSVPDFENYSIMMSNTEKLLPSNRGIQLGFFLTSYTDDPQYIKLSPTSSNEVLIVTNNYSADRIYLSNADNKNIDKPELLERIDLGFCNYTGMSNLSDRCQVIDIEWLPDASGFLVSMYFKQYEGSRTFFRIYKHNLKAKKTDMLLSLENEYIGNIAVSPDAKKVAFERGIISTKPFDIWIYNMANDSLDKLIEDAAAPAWK